MPTVPLLTFPSTKYYEKGKERKCKLLTDIGAKIGTREHFDFEVIHHFADDFDSVADLEVGVLGFF